MKHIHINLGDLALFNCEVVEVFGRVLKIMKFAGGGGMQGVTLTYPTADQAKTEYQDAIDCANNNLVFCPFGFVKYEVD